ncbi:unnamed protein product [Ixodes hexagonus]
MTAAAKEAIQSVQVFGRKKTATAVAYCKRGNGLLKVNGRPLENIEPLTLRYKLLEPILLLGKERFAGVDIRIRVKGGGNVAQIYGEWSLSQALLCALCRCGRAVKEGDQGHADPVRPHPAGCRPQALRAQEVWWTWRSCPLPEVLPLISQ